MKIANSVLELIGSTPMVRLGKVTKGIEAEVVVKLEYLNPSGSVKDRIALRMVEDAEKQGRLKPGMKIVEASTGNTATSLALVGAVKGYKVVVYIPSSADSEERTRIIKCFGAEVIPVEIDDPNNEFLKSKGIHGSVAEVIPRQVCLSEERANPDGIWWARQFNNPSNVAAHRESTGKEILDQTDGKVDAFVTALGTAGTLTGVAETLRAHNPNVKIFAVEPKNSRTIKDGKLKIPIIEGISGGFMLELERKKIADEVIAVDEDDAIQMSHRLAEEEGLFCGLSSGGNVFAALKVARSLGKGQRVVALLVDHRDRYLFRERWTT
jgi:cysteine synthase